MTCETTPAQTQPLCLCPGDPVAVRPQPVGPPVLVAGGRVVTLSRRRPLVVGSGPGCDLWLDNPFVSRRHARVTWTSRGVIIEDLQSTNGLRFKGLSTRQALVEPGQGVLLGRCPLVIAEALPGSRFQRTVRWQGMVARARESLLAWERLVTTAETSLPVWLRGESGVGKELMARAIHHLSPRHNKPFVALNCAALPSSLAEAELFGVCRGAYTGAERSRAGLFSQADGGTLLLDEVGELPADVQAKLLRVLETGVVRPVGSERATEVNVRVLAASWRDLEADAQEGRFRFDLLQRVAVLTVPLAPLRARRADIGPLLEVFLANSETPSLWPDAELFRQVELHSWPGNVRQLRSHALRASAMGTPSLLRPESAAHLAPSYGRRAPLSRLQEGVALARVRGAIAACGGNRAEAARSLGVSRSTLYRWLSEKSEESSQERLSPIG